MGTSPWRTDRNANSGVDPIGHQREVLLLVNFLIWRYQSMRPRARDAVAPKPQSALAAVMAVRRVRRLQRDIELASTRLIGLALKGLLRDFVHHHGSDALLPSRKQPMTVPLLSSILALPLAWTSDAALFNFRVMLCTLLQTGFRKSEVALPNGESFGPGRLSRASLTWFVHGSYHTSLSPALAAALSPGDAAVIVPPPSKADPFGLKFSSTPIYLPYDRDHVCNAAAHLAALEVRFPCSDRAAVPLFAVDGRSRPFSHSQADRLLASCLARVLPPDQAAGYSLHSFRIGLACALLAAGASRDEIMARVRWSDPAMTTVYARPNPGDAMRSSSRAMLAPVSSTTAARLPRFDFDHVAIGLHSLGSGFDSLLHNTSDST